MKLKISLWALLLSTNVLAQELVELPSDVVPLTDEATETDMTEEELNDLAFKLFLQREFNLTPEQLRIYAERQRKEAEALKRQKPAVAIKKIDTLDLSPMAKPYRVYTTPGWDSHISFIDASGAIWPITYKSVGSSVEFPVEQIPTDTSNTLKVNSKFRVGSSNLTVGLQGMDELITLEIVSDKDKYHSSLSLQIGKLGPNSDRRSTSTSTVSMMSSEPHMQLILQGGLDLPKEFNKLKTSTSQVTAWSKGDSLFVLTELSVHGIDPISVRHGPGGYTAYELKYLPSLLFTNDNGTPISVFFQKDRSKYEY